MNYNFLTQIDLNNMLDISKMKTIAGIDLAYWKKGNDEYAVCCIVVIDITTMQMIENRFSFEKILIPYMPGCLAFRELPLILNTIQTLEEIPDVYMFDENGYLHPYHMGIATHASFYLNKPTIGVAKLIIK